VKLIIDEEELAFMPNTTIQKIDIHTPALMSVLQYLMINEDAVRLFARSTPYLNQ